MPYPFPTINRNSPQNQSLDIGQKQQIGGRPDQPQQGPGSVIGQENAKSLKTGQQVWEASVRQFVQDNQDLAGAAGSHLEPQNDPVGAQRTAITPSMLKDARKNKLKELPVYLCSRPLAGTNVLVKGKGLHGFVAIGQPGLADVKGAKVYSYGADERTGSFKFSSQIAEKLADAKETIKEHDALGNVKDVEKPVFSPAAIESFKRMASKHDKFHSFADFHRAYYVDRMNYEELHNEVLLDGKTGIAERKANYERLKKEYENLPKDVNKDVKKEARRKMRAARTAYRSPVVTANMARKNLRYAINEDAVNAFATLKKGAKGSSSGGLPGDALRGWQPDAKDITGDQNLASADVALFEKPGAQSEPGVEFKRQQGVKATDVIEAQRQQWAADNFRDEKAGRVAELGLAPELLEEISILDLTKEPQDIASEFDASLVKSKSKLERGKYAPITDGDKEATAFGKDARAIRDRRTYAPLLVVKNEKRGIGFRILSFFKKVFRSKASRLRNEGNCNAAAGSLVRMAAKRGGKRIQAEGGKHQHGLSKDVLWNPTPNLRQDPQKQTDFIATGSRPPGMDIDDELPGQHEISASRPGSERLLDVTQREIEELKESARAINQAFRDLQETGDLMERFVPKPHMHFKRERFQDVRDAMSGLMVAIESGDENAISKASDQASKAAGDFHETRMDQYFEKNDKAFDSSSRNLQELKARVSIKGTSSGDRKMLLANSAKNNVETLRKARQNLIDNMEHTLSKPKISDVEAQKLLIGAQLLANLNFPDEAFDDLVDRAQDKVEQARASGQENSPDVSRQGTIV